MATDEALRLLDELKTARGTLDRAAVLGRGVRALARMDGREQRELALAVAERVAPQLLPRIEAETGATLTEQQVAAVLDLVRRLEPDQIDDVLDTLTAPPHAVPTAEWGTTPGRVRVVPPPAASEPKRGVPEPDVPEPDVPEPEPDVPTPPAPEPRPDELPPVEVPDEPIIPEPTPEPFEVPEEIPPFPRDDRPDAGVLTAVDALPDGWRRRRGVLAMIADGAVETGDAQAVLSRFARASDRTWVAASMCEAGLLDVDQLAGILDDRAAGRLARRYA
jgi:hypothetical protein